MSDTNRRAGTSITRIVLGAVIGFILGAILVSDSLGQVFCDNILGRLAIRAGFGYYHLPTVPTVIVLTVLGMVVGACVGRSDKT